MNIYDTLKDRYRQELTHLKQKYNTISTFRVLIILLFFAAVFYCIKTQNDIFVYSAVVLLAVFLMLMRWHTNISRQKQFAAALLDINEKEIQYLNRMGIPFEDGADFNDFKHPYVYDLDIFGPHSLF